ncbi:hydroxymethylbilane synthase [Halobacteriales archaeon QH_10_70_21]|nr:MAG: hydroxymethylbilane synthase [Halobacteriales archaeon QH_10_70_21]
MTETIRLATRGSDLALRQTQRVARALESRRREVELVEVETTGDSVRDELIHRLGTTGAFVRSLDERVIEREVDAAVHSMKDMPTEFPEELVVGGVPERAPAGDVLLTPGGADLSELPEGATVGTSSLRRKAQLLSARPAELERRALGREVDIAFDAIVLAEAGLERIDLLAILEFQRLDPPLVPAPGQGAIAVTARDDDVVDALRHELDHPRTRVATTVERTVLETLGGGCVAPVGIHAIIRGEYVHTRVRVLSQDGTEEVAATRDLPVDRHPEAAREFAEELADEGAAALIQRARREVGE